MKKISSEEKNCPPPDYREIHQQLPYNPVSCDSANPDFIPENDADKRCENLTSIYDEEENGLFGGISLFYFLIYSAFSSLLPFLSIILYHHGYSISQIGTIYTASFLISCLSSSVWSLISERSTNKHSMMLLSIIAWIIGFAPLLLIKHHDPITHCVTTENQTVNSTTDVITAHKRRPSFKDLSSGLELWKKVDLQFIVLISIFCVSRIIQSGTDYFYFDHSRLMYPEIIKRLTTSSYHVSTKISAAVITVFVGFMLDSIIFCNTSLGHFQVAFYLFLVFLSFSVFVLYFLDVDYFQKSQTTIQDDSYKQIVTCPLIFKSILVGGLIVMGASRGVNYAFLNFRLASLDALYLQIGAVFAVHKITETSMKLFRRKLSCLGVFETFILVLCMEGIRNLYYGFMENRFMAWFLLPLELLSGFPAILFMNHSSTRNNGLISERLFFVSYWCMGFSFGPLLFSFGYELWSAEYMFRGIGITNLVLGLLILLSYFTSSSNEIRKRQQSIYDTSLIGKDGDDENDSVEFLINDNQE